MIRLYVQIESSIFASTQIIFYAVKDRYLKEYRGIPVQAVKRFGDHHHPEWQRGDDDGIL